MTMKEEVEISGHLRLFRFNLINMIYKRCVLDPKIESTEKSSKMGLDLV